MKMKINKVVWNMKGDGYCVAKVGHSLMQDITRENPKVTKIIDRADTKGVLIYIEDDTIMQICNPDEIYYEPAKED